jgi:4-amino-4-deoxy-L-arabinose transferase-like glycosyltransferase
MARYPFERLFDALVDPARCERAMGLLLTAYAAVWTVYATISKSGRDIHSDMGELFSWSQEVGLGTSKHPPLAAWLTGAWFSVFPREDWAYYLLAIIVATLSLWIVWKASKPYLPPDKRVIGIALLTFVPFYNFHAIKFNVNTVLMPCWAATTWWFLRSLETRRAQWAILAGIGAAAAMLGKYWSIFLLGGLGVAALQDARRTAYFRSPAPWLTILVGTVLMAPHIAWLIKYDFEPFRYALNVHEATFLSAASSSFDFIAGSLAYIAAPIVLSVVATRPTIRAVEDTLWPAEPERRTIVIAFAAPLILAGLAAIPLQIIIVSLWSMSAMTLLPTVLLSSPLVVMERAVSVRLLVLAVGFPLLMVAISPLVAITIHSKGTTSEEGHYRLIAQAVEHAWRKHTNLPLRIVGSSSDLANGVIFYLPDRPSTFVILNPRETPWVDDARIRREGIAIVCPEQDMDCNRVLDSYAEQTPGAQSEETILARRYFGTLDSPERYRIVVIIPNTSNHAP